jgi:hypothetical protein
VYGHQTAKNFWCKANTGDAPLRDGQAPSDPKNQVLEVMSRYATEGTMSAGRTPLTPAERQRAEGKELAL